MGSDKLTVFSGDLHAFSCCIIYYEFALKPTDRAKLLF